jgi:hypothetical protein
MKKELNKIFGKMFSIMKKDKKIIDDIGKDKEEDKESKNKEV